MLTLPLPLPPLLPPPLLQRQVKSHAPRLQFGETTYVQSSSYFLGQLHSGQLLQSFETNLFRAPVSVCTSVETPGDTAIFTPSLPPPPPPHQIYRHTMPDTDLVVIISGSQVFVRDIPAVFLVGQQCPKVEVPPPNSKSAMQFQKDFLLVSNALTSDHIVDTVSLSLPFSLHLSLPLSSPSHPLTTMCSCSCTSYSERVMTLLHGSRWRQ